MNYVKDLGNLKWPYNGDKHYTELHIENKVRKSYSHGSIRKGKIKGYGSKGR